MTHKKPICIVKLLDREGSPTVKIKYVLARPKYLKFGDFRKLSLIFCYNKIFKNEENFLN